MPVNPEDAIAFTEGSLKLTKGKWAASPFLLDAWQQVIIRKILSLTPEGRRRYREVILGMARKNGKTELTAAICLALLILDEEPGGEVIGAAAKRDQARLILEAAKRMVWYGSIGGRPLSDFLKVQRDHIYFPETDSIFRVIAAEAQKEHGSNPHAFVVDEGHAALETSRELYDTLLTAQGTRDNPLGIIITTAGPVPSGPMHDLYKYGKEIESGLRNDPEFCFIWYEADPGADVDDPRAWEAANPGLEKRDGSGGFVRRAFLEKAARDVIEGKSPEFMFRRLHLNQWTTATERWLPYQKWKACGKVPAIPDGAPIYVAMDAALKRDSFAVVWAWVESGGGWTETEDGLAIPADVVHVRCKVFTPDREGAYIDPLDVETYVLGLAQMHPIQEVCYDPAYMQLIASSLADRGLPMEPFPQSAERMTTATETLQRVVIDERLRHGDDPVLNEQIASIAIAPTERGVRISKRKSTLRIDAAVALSMVLARALGEDEPQDVALAV